jgi:hypothetical protein
VDYQAGGAFHDAEIPVGEDFVFDHLQCKAAR